MVKLSMNETHEACIPTSSSLPYLYLMIGIIMALPNFIMLSATIISFRIIRHNVVYYYVINMFVCAFLISLLMLYECGNFIGMWEVSLSRSSSPFDYDMKNKVHKNIMNWYVFRRSAMAVLVLVSILNVAAFTFGVGSTSYFVGRYLAYRGSMTTGAFRLFKSDKTLSRNALLKRRKLLAFAIIFLTWLIPIFFCGWSLADNCLRECLCLPAWYDFPTCYQGSGMVCSMIWVPLSHVSLLLICIPWVLMHLLHLFMLRQTIKSFYDVVNPNVRSTSNESGTQPVITRTTKRKWMSVRPISKLTPRGPTDSMTQGEEKDKFKTLTIHRHPQNLKKMKEFSASKVTDAGSRPSLDPMIILLLTLTGCNLVLFLPLPILLILDYSNNLNTNDTSIYQVIIFIPICIYYCLVPWILLKYMSGLKKSLKHLMIKLPCFRQTVVLTTTKKVISNCRVAEVNTVSSKVEEGKDEIELQEEVH